MPAAAVIPAPIAYIKVVAVKKLVVEILIVWVASFYSRDTDSHPLANICSPVKGWRYEQAFYLEKNRVFQAGLSGMR